MRPTSPLLRVHDLSVTHVDAVHPSPSQLSFEVTAGEVVIVMGPSGSGKSTLARALNGLIPQSVDAEISGTVEVAGRDTQTTPVAALSTDISMVFQDPDSQLVTGTVLDEVAFGLENLLLPVPEVLARAEAALRQVGLWHRRSWNPDLLSGGGRQRLAIACALAMRSRVIVLDEPTAHLDPAGVADVYAALAELAADSPDRALVLIEHNVDAALRFATRVIVLDHEGRMLLDGPALPTLRENASQLDELGVWLPSWALPATTVAPPAVPSGPAAITVRDLVVRKHGSPVLQVPELDIPQGSFTAIVGSNGAGKTTLLQALSGVVPPPRGTVHIAGLDAGRTSPRRLSAEVGFVFQNPEHQFIAGTLREELAHGLRLQRLDENEISIRVDEMLDRFGLRYKADEHPFLLSGGEKRRLSVGTALITRPKVIALDEPTFGQDRARAMELLDLLRELQVQGTTIVIVTHDLRLVAEHATHVIALGDGAVVASGPTASVQLASIAGAGSADQDASPAATVPRAGAPATEPIPTDPFAESKPGARYWLHHLNPLAKLGAVIPAMILLVFTRDLLTPALFIALSYLLLFTGARLSRRTLLALLAGVPLAVVVLTFGFGVWISPSEVADSPVVLQIGDWPLHQGALLIGLATALRLSAILALALLGGITTRGPDLVRASVQQLRVPYRIGYTALAAYRFVPRFGYELAVIRAAHRVRGHGYGGAFGGRGPVSTFTRGWGYVVPLLASGIRHAERVALSMDSRAFGAYPTRTERHLVPWRVRDTVFIAALLAASAAIFFAAR